jgi:hypothetical protein
MAHENDELYRLFEIEIAKHNVPDFTRDSISLAAWNVKNIDKSLWTNLYTELSSGVDLSILNGDDLQYSEMEKAKLENIIKICPTLLWIRLLPSSRDYYCGFRLLLAAGRLDWIEIQYRRLVEQNTLLRVSAQVTFASLWPETLDARLIENLRDIVSARYLRNRYPTFLYTTEKYTTGSVFFRLAKENITDGDLKYILLSENDSKAFSEDLYKYIIENKPTLLDDDLLKMIVRADYTGAIELFLMKPHRVKTLSSEYELKSLNAAIMLFNSAIKIPYSFWQSSLSKMPKEILYYAIRNKIIPENQIGLLLNIELIYSLPAVKIILETYGPAVFNRIGAITLIIKRGDDASIVKALLESGVDYSRRILTYAEEEGRVEISNLIKNAL